jgi:hypothetical protein
MLENKIVIENNSKNDLDPAMKSLNELKEVMESVLPIFCDLKTSVDGLNGIDRTLNYSSKSLSVQIDYFLNLVEAGIESINKIYKKFEVLYT